MWSSSLALAGATALTRRAQAACDREGRRAAYTRPLVDLGHARLPDLARHEQWIDALPTLLGAAVVGLALARPAHRARLGQTLATVALVTVLRCVCVSVTVLPSPICRLGRGVRAVGGCHDCIFSGHTALTLVLAHTLAQMAPRLAIPLAAYCVLTSLLIVATRSHYTIDVLVAWIVVYAVLATRKILEWE